MKICIKCHINKKITEFYSHPQMKDGHLNKCKICCKIDAINNRNKNKEYYLNYDKKRASLPHRVKARKEYSQSTKGKKVLQKIKEKWAINNPLKRKTQIIFANAVKSGKIKREKCKFCKNEKTHGHHYDYSKPMDVIWLCRSCHAKFHYIERLSRY